LNNVTSAKRCQANLRSSDHHPLLFRGKRRERRSGYAGRNLHRRLGCAPPAIGDATARRRRSLGR
jgi:hypothetical protein